MTANSTEISKRSLMTVLSHSKLVKELIGEPQKRLLLQALSMRATMCVSLVKMSSVVLSHTDMLMYSSKIKMVLLCRSTMLKLQKMHLATLLHQTHICLNMPSLVTNTAMLLLIPTLLSCGKLNSVTLLMVLRS